MFLIPIDDEENEIDLDDEYKENVCITTSDSADPDKKCVFPFTHDGFIYNGCPIDPIDETKRWCSTKTNDKGKVNIYQLGRRTEGAYASSNFGKLYNISQIFG